MKETSTGFSLLPEAAAMPCQVGLFLSTSAALLGVSYISHSTLTPHQSVLRRKALLVGLHCMDYCLQYEQTKHKKSENQLLASILAAIKSFLHFPIVPYYFWCLHSRLTEQFYHIVRAGSVFKFCNIHATLFLPFPPP